MYKLKIKEIYYEIVFVFDDFSEASDFLEKAMIADRERKYKYELIKVVK